MAPIPFQIKICGVRSCADVEIVAQSGGDAVGLNFYPPSVRYVEPELAKALALRAQQLAILPVGVFVNSSTEDILRIASALGLTTCQLHGDERSTDAESLVNRGFRVIRAVRLPAGQIQPEQISSLIACWLQAGCSILLDADAGVAFGGAGRSLDWPSILRWQRQREDQVPFGLAGGLNPKSVAEAIHGSGAAAVDVASGVESVRGTKNPALVAEFICEAKRALGDAFSQ